MDGLYEGNLETIAASMGNVLEEVSITEHPILEKVKKELTDLGAICAQMSGSGPTVFGIFRTYDQAREAKKQLWGKYKTVYICTPV